MPRMRGDARSLDHGVAMTKLCHCGSCEQAIERAIGIADKMLRNGECSIFLVAVGSVLQGIGVSVASKQLESGFLEHGAPPIIAELMAKEEAISSCAGVAEKVTEVWQKGVSGYVEALNVSIAAANEAYAAERNLPKGD